ncbi:potassium-transporting ATPase subunit F [Modestobacter sp. Leaf380]
MGLVAYLLATLLFPDRF